MCWNAPKDWNKSIDKILSILSKAKNNKPINDRAKLYVELANQTGIRAQEWFSQTVPGSGVKFGDIKSLKNNKI